jgi:N utilization substance protein B
MASRREAREWAVQLLFQLDFNPGDPDQAFSAFWTERTEADPKSRQFVEELVRGTLEQRAKIDELIQKSTENWHLSRMAGVDRNILRLAVYEMFFRGDIPHAVAINEAVELAKMLGDVRSSRFVNGVLDRARKEMEKNAAAGDRKPE